MKLIISTSNILSAGSSIRRSPRNSKSNAEFIESLRTNFAEHSAITTNGQVNGDSRPKKVDYQSWTTKRDGTLEIPSLDFSDSALAEEKAQYDITVKLFYLPGATKDTRATHTREALDLVLKELHIPSIDLLIVSFPGIYFDEEEDCPDKLSTRGPVEAEPEPLEGQLETWKTLEALHDEGLVGRLGIAEFGKERLKSLLDKVRIKPSVDQINLRDCCSVPRDLMSLAKSRSVELLVHNDCSNVLPRGTLRDLLGPEGAAVLSEPSKAGDKRKSLHGEENTNGNHTAGLSGEVQPQWVVKYTAVVKNRGVLENKGYFAVADLG
ncbi:Putative glutamate--cysteine ligase regulatory subunit [Fulvia fulva]|nr:putative glutamate--cysteine ligase regulatory subunit [Fulvia fulva]WPV10191.1 Putative glutamate--cysteine ligase regulatory subunit [Fulvia fulva]WPV23077.1 Putative glutamate--cysteine ligase regulatory subunit [Fulvia fulva]